MRYIHLIIVIGFLLGTTNSNSVQAQSTQREAIANWQEIQQIEQLWRSNPDPIRTVIRSLDRDINSKRFNKIEDALSNSDTVEAAGLLLRYFKEKDPPTWFLNDVHADKSDGNGYQKEANQLLHHDKLTLTGVTAEIPKTKDGGWNWHYTGPESDDEFGYELNRHTYFIPLLEAYRATGNSDYARKFDLIIRDWTLHNPLPEKDHAIWRVHRINDTSQLDWRDIGEVVWRDLEAGVRLGESWLAAFWGFQQSDVFTPAARLLMLGSIINQAEYLKNYHKKNHNWTTMEMNGLGLAGLLFPEFKQAEKWTTYAISTMEKELNQQVYPDGTQTELSTKTQWVALNRFEMLRDHFLNSGQTVPESYTKRLEEMYRYLARSMRPDGHQPLNNDSDREDLRPRIRTAAEKFNRPDWLYIASNGKKGERPKGLSSSVFPWAGIHIMRGGWAPNSHWSYFDTGPFGTGHQHTDMLHLSIHAHGRDILVDGGRFTHENYFSFDPATWRGYFRSSFSHNVILVDGYGQRDAPTKAKDPLREGIDYVNTDTFDYATGTFSSGFGKGTGNWFTPEVMADAEHTRAVLFLKSKYWLVVDRIKPERPSSIEVLWHFAPDVSVHLQGEQAVSVDPNKGNLRIVPLNQHSRRWNVKSVRGQTEPHIQGWYSETYGSKQPNATIIYSADIEGQSTFAWLLLPSLGKVPNAEAKIVESDEQSESVTISIKIDDKPRELINVPLYNAPNNIRARTH